MAMSQCTSPSVLLLTPPFTQLNTPYPATMYLKGFLNTQVISNRQADLGIEVILKLFSKEGLLQLFSTINDVEKSAWSDNSQRMIRLQETYIATIDAVISFLQYSNPTLAYQICNGDFLPEANRFAQLDDMEWAFGTLGIQDKARHYSTLYLEDLADLIKETVDPHFGFSRYAERLAMSANSFDELHAYLQAPLSYTDELLAACLEKQLQYGIPQLVCISVPFPGNLYGALRCGQYLKENHPDIRIVMGGGFPNTELRSLSDPRVFDYVDFITLDDGERPLLCLWEYLQGTRPLHALKRTYALGTKGEVVYHDASKAGDIPFGKTGTPDYSDLSLDKYLSVIEVANPMHRLWSDGRWNKLTMAQGCYWKKCSFCDISLDYIQNYRPVNAALLCDRIEEMVRNTGETGFHFVDEAAPPALMRDLALEILHRRLTITWWANIRFEQRFTDDLCQLLKASGCIAVSGGLEVASDRLLKRMEKGVTVAQVAQVSHNFTSAGIMVHAYLMYGFPTQTEQETIDSLEMVRQLFEQGVIQSGFWHRFAMTAHSPVGLAPESYGVVRTGPEKGGFAYNDLVHEDPEGADHELFSTGLRKSLFNYMHGICFDFELQEWFDFDVPETDIPTWYIEQALATYAGTPVHDNSVVIWLGEVPYVEAYRKKNKGKQKIKAKLFFENKTDTLQVICGEAESHWLSKMLSELRPQRKQRLQWSALKASYEAVGLTDFEKFTRSQVWRELRKHGLLLV